MHNEAIKTHGENLNRIFKTGVEPITLCKKLRRLENKAHQLATDYCNGENGVTTETWDAKTKPVMEKVYKLLNNGIYNDDRPHMRRVPVFLNGDARGYALKINDSYIKTFGIKLHTDWGGYGIVAPDLSEGA